MIQKENSEKKLKKFGFKLVINQLALFLVAAVLFAALPAAPAQAAVVKPTGLKITIRKKSNSKIAIKCTWKANSSLRSQYILQYSAPDTATPGEMRGEGGMTSYKGIIEVEEGLPYTFVLQVRTYNQNGETSSIAKKTKKYLLVGKATKKVRNIISKNISSGMSDFDKVRFVHDWIVKNYTYDSSSPIRTFHEAISGKKAVCQGYALTFLAFMEQMKLPCYFVYSSNGAHSWNIVKVNGKWYHIDVTNDDPKSYESTTNKYPVYTFFLQSTENFQKKVNSTGNHQYDTSIFPSCTSTKYDNPACIGDYQEQIPEDDQWSSDNTFKPWIDGSMIE